MKSLNSFINEALIPPAVWKKVGMLLLSSLVPFLISLGVRMASLKIDNWLDRLVKKYPDHKEAIDILAKTINDHFGGLKKCNKFISDSEQQKIAKKLSPEDMKKEILPLINDEEDRKKVEDLLDLIDDQKFKEEIVECIKDDIENMIVEGLNININDIEDDKLRENVIKYFKTFKKNKLNSKDLDKVVGDENDNDDDDDLKSLDDTFKKLIGEEINLDDMDDCIYENLDEFINYIVLESDKINDVPDKLADNASSKIKDVIITAKIMADNVGGPYKKLYEILKKTCTDAAGRVIKSGKKIWDRYNEFTQKRQEKELKMVSKVFSRITSNKFIENIKKNNKDKWEEYEKELSNKHNKDLKNTEKDSEGNIVKKEEIIDKDGKKKNVITHTGPRGGRFYWPEGSPKDSEHKVYIDHNGKVKECMDLKDYLYESFK